MISKLLLSLASIQFHGNETHHPMEDWHMGGGWWFWFIIMIVVGLVVIILVYLVLKEEGDRGMSSYSEKSAEKILDERFARGEIDEDEYKQMKKELRK